MEVAVVLEQITFVGPLAFMELLACVEPPQLLREVFGTTIVEMGFVLEPVFVEPLTFVLVPVYVVILEPTILEMTLVEPRTLLEQLVLVLEPLTSLAFVEKLTFVEVAVVLALP